MFGLGEGSATDSKGEKLVGWGTAPTAGEGDSIDVCSFPLSISSASMS